jgi:NAD(P)-dependent dehydrogenase (short-subunit alcohol dehydrogenase family)
MRSYLSDGAGAIEEPDAAVSIVNQIFTSIGSVKAKVPMRRCGKGTEIANAVIFLLSPASSYITVSRH